MEDLAEGVGDSLGEEQLAEVGRGGGGHEGGEEVRVDACFLQLVVQVSTVDYPELQRFQLMYELWNNLLCQFAPEMYEGCLTIDHILQTDQ